MTLTLADLFASPDHYLHSFADGAAVFVRMDRDAYRRSVFLDDRIEPAAPGAMRVPLAMLTGKAAAPRRTSWIFHVAHCGSTLLANALDALGPGLVLREPLALRQLAVTPNADDGLVDIELAMLGKSYDPAAPTLVKANVPVNFMLDRIATQDPSASAILLYLGLDDYLCAILRSDNHRQWLRTVSGQLAHHLGSPDGHSDAQLAAALWQAQLSRFEAARAALPQARSLDAEAFYADPAALLAAAARLLGFDDNAAAVARVLEGPVFATYSKRPGAAFSNAERLARQDAARIVLADEIAAARHWLDAAGHDPDAMDSRIKDFALT